jgi:putative selenium metabolism hydrolase
MENSDLIAFTQSLIRQRSTSSREQEVVEIIVQEMNSLVYDKVWVDENGSAVGEITGARPGPTLLLDAHCDVVNAIPSDWSHDPYAAEIVGNVMYGRGTADTKGNLAAMIFAAARMNRSTLAGTVAVSATVDEELMEGPALKTVIDMVQPDFVVIGEATDFNLNRGGRGRAELVIETVGLSAHSSSPQVGLCAIHEMIKVIKAVEDIDVESDPLLGPGFMVLTDIISEPYPGHSVIANRCRATYDRRLLVGETMDSVVSRLDHLPELKDTQYSTKVLFTEHETYTGAVLRGWKFYPAWKFEENHPFVKGALSGLRSAGLQPKIEAFRFCTNAAYSAGTAGIPTVGFGLGKESDAHTVDEHIRVADLEQAERGYKGIIESILF